MTVWSSKGVSHRVSLEEGDESRVMIDDLLMRCFWEATKEIFRST
jgi:hypothetical protein